jgi:hypothetical protein
MGFYNRKGKCLLRGTSGKFNLSKGYFLVFKGLIDNYIIAPATNGANVKIIQHFEGGTRNSALSVPSLSYVRHLCFREMGLYGLRVC